MSLSRLEAHERIGIHHALDDRGEIIAFQTQLNGFVENGLLYDWEDDSMI